MSLFQMLADARAAARSHDAGKDCGQEKCKECCPHSDVRDHGICLDCEHEVNGPKDNQTYDTLAERKGER